MNHRHHITIILFFGICAAFIACSTEGVKRKSSAANATASSSPKALPSASASSDQTNSMASNSPLPIVTPSAGLSPSPSPSSSPGPIEKTTSEKFPPTVSNEAALALFKDKMDFTYPEVLELHRPYLKEVMGATGQNILPWPAEMKTFLALELSRFPSLKKIIDSGFLGYYYVNAPTTPSVGTAYIMADGKRQLVIINKTYFTRSKTAQNTPLYKIALYKNFQSPNILHIMPDPMLETMFHELFHVLDYVQFTNPLNTSMSADRLTLLHFSWNSTHDSKFPALPAANAMGLDSFSLMTDSAEVCSPKQGFMNVSIESNNAPGFSFIGDVTENQARAVQATNFLDDYAMTSGFEDFAQSMAIYYSATRYNQYGLYRIYDRDARASGDPKNAKILYSFDELEMMRNSKAHHDKICAMAKTVLGEDCAKTLSTLVPEI